LAYDEWINSLYTGENLGHPYWRLDECQFRAFGGNTNCWGGWCRPLDEIAFENRSWIPHSGWPFSARELDPYYGPAHKILQIQSASYDLDAVISGVTEAKILPLNSERFETHLYRFSPPTRFRHTYFDDIDKSNNIRCFIHANVTNMKTNTDGREVEQIVISCFNGKQFSIRATVFVLAAGGIENARLLLNSRDHLTCGLGNCHDLVGRFFMEHPHTKRRIIPIIKSPISLYGLNYYYHGSRPGHGFSARLSLTPSQQEHEKLLAYSANIHSFYLGCEGEGWLALRKVVLTLSNERKGDPFLRFPPYGLKRIMLRDIWQIVRTLPQTTVAGFLSLFQSDWFLKGYMLESKSEQAPNPDSRVILQSEKDAFGLNRVALDWQTLPIDRYTVIRAEEILETELRRLNIGTLEPLAPEELTEWPKRGLEGGWHQLGTTRMSDDPRQGVVDRHCRIHGISNLFVTGGSVFPAVGAEPPTLTIVALALRLAAHLKQRFDTVKIRESIK
jgi:choline dehydrogenase-like flavoprotein